MNLPPMKWLNRLKSTDGDDALKSPSPRLRGRCLAVDWTGASITVTEIAAQAEGVTVVRRFHGRWPDDGHPRDDPHAAGRWLRGELERSGINGRAAFVSVPRQHVVLKLLELPDVDGDRIVDLVRIQAEVRTGQSLDDVCVDCLPQPRIADGAPRYVLLTILPQDVAASIVDTLACADIDVRSLGVGELALPVLGNASASSLHVDVLCNDAKTELVLSRFGSPLASHAVESPRGDADKAAAFVSANIARVVESLPESLTERTPTQVSLWGTEADRFVDRLNDMQTCDVVRMSCESDRDVRVLALASALHRQIGQVDFLNPRRRPDAAAGRRRNQIRVAACVATMIGLTAWWFFDEQSMLDRRVAALQHQQRDLDTLLERGRPTLDAQAFLAEWDRSSVSWSDELYEFLAMMPDPDRAYLTRLQLERRLDAAAAAIRTDGYARSADDVLEFNARVLEHNDRYDLQPRGIEPGQQDAQFRTRFTTDVLLRSGEPGQASEEASIPDDT